MRPWHIASAELDGVEGGMGRGEGKQRDGALIQGVLRRVYDAGGDEIDFHRRCMLFDFGGGGCWCVRGKVLRTLHLNTARE
jgi:hypothetical protein